MGYLIENVVVVAGHGSSLLIGTFGGPKLAPYGAYALFSKSETGVRHGKSACIAPLGTALLTGALSETFLRDVHARLHFYSS